jgi:hypothetical protein
MRVLNSLAGRKLAVVLCLAAVGTCLGYDYWRAELPDWWRGHGGGIPYVLFWATLWFVVFPFRRAIVPVCVGVTLVTCGLEFLQLWQPPWLIQFRATRLGAALLGNGFTWSDFPPYLLGGLLACGILNSLVAISARESVR